MRAETGREDRGVEESGGEGRLSLLALSTLMYFPYSTETHIAKRGRAGALVGAQLVCVLDRGEWEGSMERKARISTAVFVLWSVVRGDDDDVVF